MREVVAFEEQRRSQLFCQSVGEAIAEIQRRLGAAALAEALERIERQAGWSGVKAMISMPKLSNELMEVCFVRRASEALSQTMLLPTMWPPTIPSFVRDHSLGQANECRLRT